MAALRRRGLEVSGHKVGPDYIDPGYHALATGRPGRNLDPFMVGEELLAPLLIHGARGADVAVIEGVMGLYDGQLGRDGFASTAHVAAVTDSPVVLVVDVSSASRSIAAIVHGMRTFDPAVRIAGVILNKAGSPRHAGEVRRAVEEIGVPVLGVLQRDEGIVAPSRHLGLVPVAERPGAVAEVDRLGEQLTSAVDLDHLLALAADAGRIEAPAWDPAGAVAPYRTTGDHRSRPRVAVAGGRAFTFTYAETEELLTAAGCEVVRFDPLADAELPGGISGIYLGGGFPEIYASELSRNRPLREDLAAALGDGVPTVAECAGLLYLCRSLEDRPMVGALPADAVMTPRLTLGYRTAVVPAAHLGGEAAARVRGHEFHRTTITPAAGDHAAYLLGERADGFGSARLVASYLHVHWAGHPEVAARFADTARDFEAAGSRAPGPGETVPAPGMASQKRPLLTGGRLADPLLHHGDRETLAGSADFAVNVHAAGPPRWLRDALAASLTRVSAYPDAAPAARALAALHAREPEEVLPTAGGAEAFTLVARARPWHRPVVVHPQFTEPEVALRAGGRPPERVLCRPEDDFAIPVAEIPADADLVVVGNPTNPTGVLHSQALLRSLVRPGRVVVVDEAFIDCVPGEPGTLAGIRDPGLLVVRSLTKLWAIPGVRAGYVVGDRALIADLRRQQPPWSVSAAAIAAMLAVTTPQAAVEKAARAEGLAADRASLVEALRRVGVECVPGHGAFVLARVEPGTRDRLRAEGIVVRRCDTFPGLDDGWVRIAVRPATQADLLVSALTPVIA